MYVCARFHEIPAKGLQDIKETKCYGRDGLTDKVKTVYPPYNFVIAGGIIIARNIGQGHQVNMCG